MIGELKLEEAAYFDFVTHHPSTAAVTDADSGPTAEVFEDATDTTVVALVVTKRTSKTGNYRVPVTAAAADGFEVGKTYNVIASATVNSITGKGRIGQFKVRARGKDDLASQTSVDDLPTNAELATALAAADDAVLTAVATRSSQTSVDDLPTNAELATSQAAADDATLAAIAAQNNLSAAQVRTELATELGRIDAAVSTRATPAQVATELGTYDGPTNAEMDARTLASANYATASNLATVAGYLDTEIAAIIAAVAALNNLSAAQVKTQADQAIVDAALATAANLALAKTAIDAIKAKTDLLPEGLKKNTALPNFPFPMLLSSDHVTGATGLTITATRKIDGGSFAACANAATEVGNGVYVINLAAADMNGDVIMLRFTAATADDRLITLKTSP